MGNVVKRENEAMRTARFGFRVTHLADAVIGGRISIVEAVGAFTRREYDRHVQAQRLVVNQLPNQREIHAVGVVNVVAILAGRLPRSSRRVSDVIRMAGLAEIRIIAAAQQHPVSSAAVRSA